LVRDAGRKNLSMLNVYESVPLDNERFEADRRWFEKHPDRTYYIRLATASEMVLAPPSPFLIYAVIRQVEPGVRVRLFDHEAPRRFFPSNLFHQPVNLLALSVV
jgi:hypothetical protein